MCLVSYHYCWPVNDMRILTVSCYQIVSFCQIFVFFGNIKSNILHSLCMNFDRDEERKQKFSLVNFLNVSEF
jgi:hypothetical protein